MSEEMSSKVKQATSLSSIDSIQTTSLNAVTAAFEGLRQVVLEYDPADEAFLEIVADDLDGEQETQPEPTEPTASASVQDHEGDTVMTDADIKPDLGVIKEFLKGMSDGTLSGYLSLIKQLERWVHDHNLIPRDEDFFRANPHEDSPSMIAAWILDSCDTVRLDGTVRPQSEVRKSYSHAQKMCAAATFGFGRLHGLGNMTWQQSGLTAMKREEATSACAITADIIRKMYNYNTQEEHWNPSPPQFAQSSQPMSSSTQKKTHLSPRFRRLLHLAYTIAFLCLLRVDEVLNITFDQINIVQHDDGTIFMNITLPYRKTAQFGTSQQFLEGFRHNLLDVGIDPAPYGTHSLRRGGCQWLSADLRWPYIKICQWGGWSTELTNATIVKYLVSWNDDPMCPWEDFFDFGKKSGVRCPMCGRSCLCWGR
ncbi:hypothetical protein E1B28_007812 [Marasmius oreades]|uniref:Tyr recombinase domain-containing protein n=1 Tax=Marasmius oreades TaxID=181124 RepID=A0A9P7UUE6_9AGAR|nr:uncharacterized protein E1B28_007812 [Marasmius oreades]KAG7094205.1 hypothetical protein E1B28_007812 [Marasmius oreades]